MRGAFFLLLPEVGGQVEGNGFFLSLAEYHRQVLDLIPTRVQLLRVYLLCLFGPEAEFVAGVHEFGRGCGFDALIFFWFAGGGVVYGSVDEEISVVGGSRKWLHVPIGVVIVVPWFLDIVGAALGLVVGVLVVGGADQRLVTDLSILDFFDWFDG